MRHDEAEQQPEADDVQADDGGGKAPGAGPLGRGQRGAETGQHQSSSETQTGHSPASGKWVKRAR